jgi:hypothetical protein
MSSDQRKTKYIDPKVQGTLARRLVFHYTIFLVGSSLFAFLLQVMTNPFTPLSQTVQELWWSQGPFILVGFCLIPVFVNDTIKLSHRFVGPIVRVHGDIKRSASGEQVKAIQLRPGDFWHELVDDFNMMLTRTNEFNSKEPSNSSNEPATTA